MTLHPKPPLTLVAPVATGVATKREGFHEKVIFAWKGKFCMKRSPHDMVASPCNVTNSWVLLYTYVLPYAYIVTNSLLYTYGVTNSIVRIDLVSWQGRVAVQCHELMSGTLHIRVTVYIRCHELYSTYRLGLVKRPRRRGSPTPCIAPFQRIGGATPFMDVYIEWADSWWSCL